MMSVGINLKQNMKGILMKIKSIKSVGKKPVYDITVKDNNSYTLANGVKSHNTGGIYSSDTILIVGKRMVKDGKDLLGHEFVLKAEKSRYIKEKSAIPITVLFDGGLYKYSSIFEWALELGYLDAPKVGWYTRPCVEGDKNWRKKEIENNADEFFKPILDNPKFHEEVDSLYALGSKHELDIDKLDEIDEMIDNLEE